MKKLGNELTLILLMTDGTDYTANDLCEHLECTRRNLYYYLQFLRDYGFKVVRNGNCYRLDPHSPFFRRITSSSLVLKQLCCISLPMELMQGTLQLRLSRVSWNASMTCVFSQMHAIGKNRCAILMT